jgi:hypothetical protein
MKDLEKQIERLSKDRDEKINKLCAENMNREEKDQIRKEVGKIDENLERLFFIQQFGKYAEQAKQFISLGKVIIKENKADAANVFKTILQLFSFFRSEMEPELNELSKTEAQALFRDLKNLKEAGFAHGEALHIILAKIKPASFTDVISKASSSSFKDAKIKIGG